MGHAETLTLQEVPGRVVLTASLEDIDKTFENESRLMEAYDKHQQKILGLIEMRRYEAALLEIREVVDIYPEDPWLMAAAAECYRVLGLNDAALFLAYRAIERDPEDFRCHFVLCQALCADNRFGQELVDRVDRMLESYPDEVIAYTIAAEAYLGLHWYEQVLAATGRGLELVPGDETCLSFRAEALFKLMRFREAKSCLLAVIESNPENFRAYSRLGWEEYQAGNLQDAEQMFVAALGLEPEFSKALEGLELVRNLLP